MAANPFLAMIQAKQAQNGGGPAGQSGGSGKGMPPQFANKGKKKTPDTGRQGAIGRRLAAMNKK